ncbi:hypothetical protein [Acinetobacter oleivorans]|uniref:hypothetical protein n=1 Tax=Acinetobacter oleivorans TaxID=1148157 RepID=UPI0012501313|nr:hypothetical protein [Acinetobacter oleivorans]
MNKFIGGYFDGREMPFENYVGDVFYAANIGDNYKTPYYRNTVERDGVTYNFWVIEGMGDSEASDKINQYFVKR